MAKEKLTIDYHIYDSVNDLPELLANLYIQAQLACNTAYAPYSNFHVGAALQLTDGRIISGSNQENSAYPSGLCAERTLLFHTHAHKNGASIIAMAVAARRANETTFLPGNPCGSCRQVMAEFEQTQDTPIQLVLKHEQGFMVLQSTLALLPFAFTKDSL